MEDGISFFLGGGAWAHAPKRSVSDGLTYCAAATIGEKELLQLLNILKSTP